MTTPKANSILDKLRTTLEQRLKPADGALSETETETETETELDEAAQRFCESGLAFIKASGYELENFDECGPDEVIDALEQIADEDASIAPKVEEFFKLHNVAEAE
jgi:hypothetical protein